MHIKNILKFREKNFAATMSLKFILLTLFKIIYFCFGLGILCFFILFLVFSETNSDKSLLKNYTLLISSVVAISSYLMVKIIEKFCLIYASKKLFIPTIVSLAVNNPIKILILVISLTWLSITQYRNFTGYCHKEGRYLTEQELIDLVIEKDFVIVDELAREKSLDGICINYGLEDEEYTKEFPKKKCGKITYKSKKEFIQKVGIGSFYENEECSADINQLFKQSQLEKCANNRFYYSSVQQFYEKNHNCCELTKHFWTMSFLENFINSFFGNYLYGLRITSYKHPFSEEQYYEDEYSVNSCGIANWEMGIGVSTNKK